MGAPEGKGLKRARRSPVPVMEWVHGAYMVMQRQRPNQRVVFQEFSVERLDELPHCLAAFRATLDTAMARPAETDVVAVAAKLPRRAVIVVTAGYDAPVQFFDKALVDRPVVREPFDPAVCVDCRPGLPLRPAEVLIGHIVRNCFFEFALGKVGPSMRDVPATSHFSSISWRLSAQDL